MKEKKNDRRMQKGSHKETPWRNIYDIQDSYVEDKQLKENKEVLTCLINRDQNLFWRELELCAAASLKVFLDSTSLETTEAGEGVWMPSSEQQQ